MSICNYKVDLYMQFSDHCFLVPCFRFNGTFSSRNFCNSTSSLAFLASFLSARSAAVYFSSSTIFFFSNSKRACCRVSAAWSASRISSAKEARPSSSSNRNVFSFFSFLPLSPGGEPSPSEPSQTPLPSDLDINLLPIPSFRASCSVAFAACFDSFKSTCLSNISPSSPFQNFLHPPGAVLLFPVHLPVVVHQLLVPVLQTA